MDIDTTLNHLVKASLISGNEIRRSVPIKLPTGFVIIRTKNNNRIKNAMAKFQKSGLKVFALGVQSEMAVFVSSDEDRIDKVSSFVLDVFPKDVW